MERTDFYNQVVVEGKSEHDFLNNSLSKFKMNYAPSYYRISQSDILRPDLISYRIYGSVTYFWIILFVNNIQNPFTGLVIGNLLTIPDMTDIFEFYQQFNLR